MSISAFLPGEGMASWRQRKGERFRPRERQEGWHPLLPGMRRKWAAGCPNLQPPWVKQQPPWVECSSPRPEAPIPETIPISRHTSCHPLVIRELCLAV
ncbi:Activating Transcription Factor 7-Interacting Protein 1 [Manis pentadactyla]|nr:Activating Transcription Factor 7-Interacting Protein 1 [Manis pentadactyla]